MKIAVVTTVQAPIAAVWRAYTGPADIVQWNAASDDWHTTRSSVDLRVGGKFSSRMEAKDGSFGSDVGGTYTNVVPERLIEYSFGDRNARVESSEGQSGVTVRRHRVRSVGVARNRGSQTMTSRTVHLHRVLRASPARVYRAFLEADAMAKWLPPYGFTCQVPRLEARVGGTFRMSFHSFATGNGHSFGGGYIELVPNELIRYTDRFDDANLPGVLSLKAASPIRFLWRCAISGGRNRCCSWRRWSSLRFRASVTGDAGHR